MKLICSKCNLSLDKSKFWKNKSTKTGFHTICAECSKARKKQHYQENKTSIRSKQSEYYEANKERILKANKEWKMTNHHLVIQNVNERKKKVRQAMPNWLSQEDKQYIKNLYWLAKDLSSVSEGKYHVDHIVPLKGENVCGLHVPWNLQVLPEDINLKKGNRYKGSNND